MAHRRHKNLGDLLVKARLTQDPKDNTLPGESKHCGGRACACCKVMTPTQVAKSSNGAPVKHQTNCKSKNVVYLITCAKCNKQYVGGIGQSLVSASMVTARLETPEVSEGTGSGTFLFTWT